MRYVTAYFDDDPTGGAIELYSLAVQVLHGDGSGHWEALITSAVYEADKATIKTYSKIEKELGKEKWLKRNGDALPRHVFGPPGNLADPEYVEEKA